MRNARDTFLHLLADNLTAAVKFVRFDRYDPNSAKLANNAVNVSFLEDATAVSVSSILVSIDLIFDDELTATDAANDVRALLQQSGFAEKRRYDIDPSNPLLVGGCLYWNPDSVRFRSIPSPFYFHLNCTLSVHHHAT